MTRQARNRVRLVERIPNHPMLFSRVSFFMVLCPNFVLTFLNMYIFICFETIPNKINQRTRLWRNIYDINIRQDISAKKIFRQKKWRKWFRQNIYDDNILKKYFIWQYFKKYSRRQHLTKCLWRTYLTNYLRRNYLDKIFPAEIFQRITILFY